MKVHKKGKEVWAFTARHSQTDKEVTVAVAGITAVTGKSQDDTALVYVGGTPIPIQVPESELRKAIGWPAVDAPESEADETAPPAES